MLVYGIKCSRELVVGLPTDLEADYYVDHGILVFPEHTKPLTLDVSKHSYVWETVRRIVDQPNTAHCMDFEHPYISESADLAVKLIQKKDPGSVTNWYYVPS
jgi:hypothetical protein